MKSFKQLVRIQKAQKQAFLMPHKQDGLGQTEFNIGWGNQVSLIREPKHFHATRV